MDKAEEKLKYPQMIDRVNYLLSELPFSKHEEACPRIKKNIYIPLLHVTQRIPTFRRSIKFSVQNFTHPHLRLVFLIINLHSVCHEVYVAVFNKLLFALHTN